MSDDFPTVRVAAAQAAPVFLERDPTVDKVEGLVAEAARAGARVVAFSESFVPGFPLWCLVRRPVDQHQLFRRLYANAVDVPGPVTQRLGDLAARHEVYLSVGITERSTASTGGLFNTNLVFGPDGRLRLRHRKLVATWAERLVWAHGDGSGLRTVDTEFGRLGMLICGENTNPLARYALIAQGEHIHVASWPPAWPFQRGGSVEDYQRWIEVRSAAHAFEGKVFTISVAGVLDEKAISTSAEGDPEAEEVLRAAPPAVSLAIGPSGRLLGKPLVGEEGILYTDCDLGDCVTAKMAHDVVCGYQRLDVFEVRLNRRPQVPLRVTEHAEDELVESVEKGPTPVVPPTLQ
ncbi:MAG TPA: carbon-nitrogen hydrolase family protein [Geodermatophilus sp.]|nr:carbon-nitrogen hydrolase family protein [Geodermatophilus sp.]